MKIYSKSTNAFYAPGLQADYVAAGSWPTDGVEVSDAVRDACGNSFGPDASGKPVPVPVTLTAAQLWAAYQTTAQSALTESDKTILRCAENAVTVPSAWATYRKALRAIVAATSGDPTQALPTRPAYPAGT